MVVGQEHFRETTYVSLAASYGGEGRGKCEVFLPREPILVGVLRPLTSEIVVGLVRQRVGEKKGGAGARGSRTKQKSLCLYSGSFSQPTCNPEAAVDYTNGAKESKRCGEVRLYVEPCDWMLVLARRAAERPAAVKHHRRAGGLDLYNID